jgi:phosphonate transport system substrate-binding protein
MGHLRNVTRLLFGALTSLLLLSPLAATAASNGELVFGVYPYLSPSQTVEQFAPLKTHLSKMLGRPVSLRSAPNFSKFVERTRAGEYDIIFTAPHMGRVAEIHDGYQPLAQTGYLIVIVAVTNNDSPIESLGALHNRSLAVGTQLSMTYQIINQALAKTGLELGKSVRFIATATFSNVLTAVLRGEADAGATGTLLWESAPPAQRAQLREIYRSPPVPGFLLLGHSRLGTETLKKLRDALHDFAGTPAGHAYFAKTQQIDFRPVDAATMKRIDPFTSVFEKP